MKEELRYKGRIRYPKRKLVKTGFKIDYFSKTCEYVIKTEYLPDKEEPFYRNLFMIKKDEIPIGKVTLLLKQKIKDRLNIDIDIENYDCEFSEYGEYE